MRVDVAKKEEIGKCLISAQLLAALCAAAHAGNGGQLSTCGKPSESRYSTARTQQDLYHVSSIQSLGVFNCLIYLKIIVIKHNLKSNSSWSPHFTRSFGYIRSDPETLTKIEIVNCALELIVYLVTRIMEHQHTIRTKQNQNRYYFSVMNSTLLCTTNVLVTRNTPSTDKQVFILEKSTFEKKLHSTRFFKIWQNNSIIKPSVELQTHNRPNLEYNDPRKGWPNIEEVA